MVQTSATIIELDMGKLEDALHRAEEKLDEKDYAMLKALKKAIRHRRNSLFYKTHHGAHVGDVFMSLIHTCELCGSNPFDYLTELERHADRVGMNPQHWLPWNYRETLERMKHAQTPSKEGCQDERCCPPAAQGAFEADESGAG
jgi:hypothetical protein